MKNTMKKEQTLRLHGRTWQAKILPRSLLALCLAAAFLLAAPAPEPDAFTLSDERQVGRELYERVRDAGLLLTDDPLVDYVESIGRRLVTQDDRYPLDFT